MNNLIHSANSLGSALTGWTLSVLWQSALVVAVIAALDRGLRHRLSAKARYCLWLLALAKLMLPPSFALPTSPAWWWPATPAAQTKSPQFRVSYGVAETMPAQAPQVLKIDLVPQKAPSLQLEWKGILALVWIAGAMSLAAGLIRGCLIITKVRRRSTEASENVCGIVRDLSQQLGLRTVVEVRFVEGDRTPAVCGWRRPVILLPEAVESKLSGDELRSVLLHELVHVKRGDLWLNLFQALLQVVWWFHPAVWLANARIRALREEAVDERVMLELSRASADRGAYPAALLSIARMCLRRETFGLALLGILEHRHSLKSRIRRVLEMPDDWRPESPAGILLSISIAGAVLLPMGCGPKSAPAPEASVRDEGPLQTRTFRVDQVSFDQNLLGIFGTNIPVWCAGDERLPETQRRVRRFFQFCGVEFPVTTNLASSAKDGRALFYNDRTGVLFVRSTSNQLETIEKAVQAVNGAPGQLVFDARFLSIKPADLESLSHKWGAALLSTNGNVLDESQTASVMKALKKQSRLDILSSPKVTTLSGRRARIEVSNPVQYLDSESGATNTISTGVSCDLLGYILPDDRTISLSATGTVTELTRSKDDKAAAAPEVQTGTASTYRILDGQTLVLVLGNRRLAISKVPGLGDLPVVGRMFQNQQDADPDKAQTIVLVTATMIDPAGSRVHQGM